MYNFYHQSAFTVLDFSSGVLNVSYGNTSVSYPILSSDPGNSISLGADGGLFLGSSSSSLDSTRIWYGNSSNIPTATNRISVNTTNQSLTVNDTFSSNCKLTCNGTGSNSYQFGNGLASGVNSIVIGNATAPGSNQISIGVGMSTVRGISIGHTQSGPDSAGYAIRIGNNHTGPNPDGINLGNNIYNNGASCSSNVGIGNFVTFNNVFQSFGWGAGCSVWDNRVIAFGGTSQTILRMFIGTGQTYSATGSTQIRPRIQSSQKRLGSDGTWYTNAPGHHIEIGSGDSTGDQWGGQIFFMTCPAGTAGNTPNIHRESVVVNPDNSLSLMNANSADLARILSITSVTHLRLFSSSNSLFGVMPGSSSAVKIGPISNRNDEFTATAGQTSFTLTFSPIGSVSMFVNGIMLSTSAYSVSSSTITYTGSIALSAGDRVNFQYIY